MTEEDKQLIAEYMGWELSVYSREYYYIPKNGKVVYFDLTDAGLCVAEMQKRGDWQDFVQITSKIHKLGFHSEVIAWLFNAENFHTSMAAWLRSAHNGGRRNE